MWQLVESELKRCNIRISTASQTSHLMGSFLLAGQRSEAVHGRLWKHNEHAQCEGEHKMSLLLAFSAQASRRNSTIRK